MAKPEDATPPGHADQPAAQTEQRVLIIAHAHPDHSLGGGELAAHGHFRELRRQGVTALFLARSSLPSGHAGAPFTARTTDAAELLFHLPPVDHFRHSQPQRQLIYQDFRALLERFRPTAVHFHHYVHLGLELLREVRRYSADIPVLLTLHDYLGICHAQGQMLKTNGVLCQRATPLDCHTCIPAQTPQQFFLRELFVKSFFNLVDVFVSPSRFLRDRYVAWGLPAERFLVLENGQAPADAAGSYGSDGASSESLAAPDLHRRFIVLGQLSRLKGSLVLLEAVANLPKAVAKQLRIEIHGSIQHADDAFQARFLAECARLAPTLRYCGPYLPQDVGSILATAGWLVIPSIWWENSPMVIQEAFRAGRPVIASNIGGMAEKVRPGINGLHFRVGSASDLARCLTEAAADAELWQRLQAGVELPPALPGTVATLRTLYGLPRSSLTATLAQWSQTGLPA